MPKGDEMEGETYRMGAETNKPSASVPANPVTPAPQGGTSPAVDPAAEAPRSVVDRRAGLDRRQKTREQSGYAGPDRRVADRRTGLERRRGAGIRRPEERKAAEEGEMTAEQFEFVMAIETYKKVNKKMFPTWTEVLEVMQQLGYRKVEHRRIELDAVPEPTLHLPASKAA